MVNDELFKLVQTGASFGSRQSVARRCPGLQCIRIAIEKSTGFCFAEKHNKE